VLGWAELGIPETTPGSRVNTYLERIRTQAERAARLTKQLLAFARRQILEPRSINLNQVVTETMEFLNSVVGEDIEIKLVLESELEMTLADPTQIEQVLLNLCLNARDAMPKGGELLIETKNVTFDEEYCRRETYARLGSFVLMGVCDTGQGMDNATIDRIFEPFFTTKELGKGTGLGLATVYGIVKQHGGFIHVYSELDRGSAFQVYLPVASATSDTNEEKIQTGPVRGGRETILLAEDQEGNREIAKEILENLGYTVLCAADGEAAVKLFESNSERIALVLLDVLMPKLSGPDALEKMRARKPALPALFATGYSTELTRLELLRRLGAEILQKPFGVATLGHRVREILDRKS
jgi:CheY-like chemotaxis protein